MYDPHTAIAQAVGGGGRNRTGVDGFAGRCMTTLPPRRVVVALRSPRWRRLPQTQRESGRPPLRNWSGKRVSNSRPQPWQGCALPTELFPREIARNYSPRDIAVKANSPRATASRDHFRDRIRDVIQIARIQRGDADAAGIDGIDGKISTQTPHL